MINFQKPKQNDHRPKNFNSVYDLLLGNLNIY